MPTSWVFWSSGSLPVSPSIEDGLRLRREAQDMHGQGTVERGRLKIRGKPEAVAEVWPETGKIEDIRIVVKTRALEEQVWVLPGPEGWRQGPKAVGRTQASAFAVWVCEGIEESGELLTSGGTAYPYASWDAVVRDGWILDEAVAASLPSLLDPE